ncbi:TcpQ domain-containing protein [Pseudomonadota bacterium AL_CKDN230030165-1A_HGKHYDSX7]
MSSLLVLLPGCGLRLGADGWVSDSAATPAWQARAAAYDFDWQLSGDAEVGPAQMFGEGREIWLQFAPGQDVPALFAQTPAGLVPLPFRSYPPYVVVRSDARELIMRAGHREARARHASLPSDAPAQPTPAPAPALSVADGPAYSTPSTDSETRSPHRRLTEADTGVALRGATRDTADAAGAKLASSGSDFGSGVSTFRAGPPDPTLRAVLARWATGAGWLFQTAHWAVDADIPLDGAADFHGDFKQAVRDLLASTELSDRPVQPCFYTNRVLRVVPLAQSCDRSSIDAKVDA